MPDGDNDRPDEREEDRDQEDDTDRAIKLAREHVIEAVQFLVYMMQLGKAPAEERVRSAIALLEVAGCL